MRKTRRACVAVIAVVVLTVAASVASAATTGISSFSKTGRDTATGSTATSGGPAGSAAAGDTINWVLNYQNSTGAPAQVNITDPITGNQSFVAGSLQAPPGFTTSTGGNTIGAAGPSIPGSRGANTQTQPGPQAFNSTNAGGDGFEALFVGNLIYNVHHHTSGNVLDCHDRTGARCSGYPTSVSGNAGDPFGTNTKQLTTSQIDQADVVGSKIYYPAGVIGATDVGVACADVATKTSCGFTKLGNGPGVQGGGGTWIMGGATVGSKYYLAGVSGEIYCFDTTTQAQCTGYPLINFADPGSGGLSQPNFHLEAWDNRYVFGVFHRASNLHADLICIDTTTNSRCPGFPIVDYGHVWNANSYGMAIVPILTASGAVNGICGSTATTGTEHPYKCYDLQGNSVPTPFSTTQTTGTNVNWVGFGSIAVIGPRVYFAETTPGGTSTYTCWDYSTASTCAGFTPGSTGQVLRAYTLRQDPVNPDCIWEEGDADRFEVFSATFGGTNCSEAGANLTVRPSQSYCDGQPGHATSWNSINVSGVTAAQFQKFAVSLTDANGDPVPGWTGRVFSSPTTSVDISSIPYAGTTTELHATVTFQGLATGKVATVTLTFNGDPAQVCYSTKVGSALCAATQSITDDATAVTDAGAAGSDAPGGNRAGAVTFTEAADTGLCRDDLSIVKTVDDANPPLGGTVHYRLVVRNNGPDDAQGVTVSDVHSAGVQLLSATPSQGSCSAPDSCQLGALPAGATATIDVTAKAVAEGTAGNTATVSSTTQDTDPSNNVSSAVIEVHPEADLEIVKTASDTTVHEGDDFTYTLVVTNHGPSTAKDAVVTDPLPTGVELRSASSSDGSCTQDDPVVCHIGDVPNGGKVTITLRVTATDTGSPENTATVVSTTEDPNPKNNQDHTKVTTDRSADLAITKTASAPVVSSGESFDWTLDVVNTGPSRAVNAVVTDPIPDGLTIVSATPSRGSCSIAGQTVTCELGTMARGATAEIVVTVQTHKAGSWVNTASVTSETPDPKPENNLDTSPVSASANADVAIAKTASADVAAVGDTIAYTLVVTNHGPDDAADVTVTDPLPSSGRFISATPSAGSCREAAAVLVCDLGTVADGAAVTISVKVTLTAAGSTRNVAQVTTSTHDPKPENNHAETTQTVEKADVSVAKQASTLKPPVGGTLTYSIIAHNAGPALAHDVVVTDPIPASLQYVSASAPRGSCSLVSGSVVCNIGDLAVGESLTVSVRAIAVRVGDAENSASAVARTPSDPNPANNVAGATVKAPEPKLRLTKVANHSRVRAGQAVTFTLRVSNPNATAIRALQVCDALPRALSYLSSTPRASHRGGRYCWTVKRLAAHASRKITVRVVPRLGAHGKIVNRANATARGVPAVRARAAIRVAASAPCASGARRGPRARAAC